MSDLRPCPDCGVAPGEEHLDVGCDVARCLAFGGQRLSCEMGVAAFLQAEYGKPFTGAEEHDCGRDVWTGVWPGVAECIEFGWYAYFEEPKPGQQYGRWVQCSADHPKAQPNLNRLIEDAVWDPEARRWQLRPDAAEPRI